MSAIKCRRCGKTIATSKRAAFPIATEYVNGTWQHKAPCEASTTPVWTKGQRVTVERLFSSSKGIVVDAAESRRVLLVGRSRLTLDDDTVWEIDGTPTKGYKGRTPAKLRLELPGDSAIIERRRLLGKIVNTRGDVWSEVPLSALRVIHEEIEAVEAGRAALAKGDGGQ